MLYLADPKGFDSRLRARSGPALEVRWTSIHYRPFESLWEKEKRDRFRNLVYGGPQGIRTPDLLVRSQTLYPAELGAHFLNAHA